MEEIRKDDEERRERTQLRAAFWQVNDIDVSCDEELILDSRPELRLEVILMALTNLDSGAQTCRTFKLYEYFAKSIKLFFIYLPHGQLASKKEIPCH